MSRSALWRQEVNVKERARVANESFQIAIEEGRNCHVKGQIPLVGPDDTFNLNPMLLHNISKSPYFIKCCQNLHEWGALVDEIYYEVQHMQPWADGGSKVPSSAFCLLLRLFTLRATEKQMTLMLNHTDSPYIRCIGFLYLRYASDPQTLYSWFEPYLYDEEPVRIRHTPSSPMISMGDYVKGLLTDMNYYGTVLPRLPVVIEREVKVKLLQEEQLENRALQHLRNERFMEYCQTVGCRIRALYGDEENPTTWYDCVVDRVIRRDDATGADLVRPKFVVTFTEYGNTEVVSLGEIDVRVEESNSWGRSRDGSRSSSHYSSSSSNSGRERNRDGYNGRNRSEYDYNRKRNDSDGRGYNRYSNQHNNQSYERGYSEHSNNEYHRRDRDRDRDRSRSRDRDLYPPTTSKSTSSSLPSTRRPTDEEDDLMAEVRRREREKSTATGRAYGRQPRTFKSSLSSSNHDGSSMKSSASLSLSSGFGKGDDNSNWRTQERERERSRKRNHMDHHHHHQERERIMTNETKKEKDPPKKMKTPEEMAAIEEKKRKLLAKYG